MKEIIIAIIVFLSALALLITLGTLFSAWVFRGVF
jgi:hypothetical protein